LYNGNLVLIMNIQKYIFFLFLLLFPIPSCTPYDSDATNTRMIQGEWILSSYQIMNTEMLPFSKIDSTVVHFSGNKYIRLSSATGEKSVFQYKIKNFSIEIFNDSTLVLDQNIVGIWADSLVLGNANNKWTYKRLK